MKIFLDFILIQFLIVAGVKPVFGLMVVFKTFAQMWGKYFQLKVGFVANIFRNISLRVCTNLTIWSFPAGCREAVLSYPQCMHMLQKIF